MANTRDLLHNVNMDITCVQVNKMFIDVACDLVTDIIIDMTYDLHRYKHYLCASSWTAVPTFRKAPSSAISDVENPGSV